MNPILATLVLTSFITAIGVYLVKTDSRDRLDLYYGIFILIICFIIDGALAAALFTASATG